MPLMIYKIVTATLWADAAQRGVFAGSPVDERDGFIHFSTADQLADTAQKHFAGQRNLLLITIDADQLDLRWEAARGGQLFPHLYGPLPLSAVRAIEPYEVSVASS